MTTQDDARRAAVAISDFEDDPKAPCPACGGNQTYCSCTIESMRAAIILKLLATPAAQPAPAEGWMLVPREPTEEMRLNGAAALDSEDYPNDVGYAASCYRAMIAAAPSQGERAGLSAEERDFIARVRECYRTEPGEIDDMIVRENNDMDRLLAIIDRLAPTPPHSPDGERE